MEDMKEYSTKRDEAIVECIRTDSVQPFRNFINKQIKKGTLPECFELPTDEVLKLYLTMMK